MEIKKYFVVKKTYTINGSTYVSYFKGYSKWVDKFDKSKMYAKIANAKKAIEQFTSTESTKYEILYITTTIETLDDIAEKELLDLG